MFEIRKSDGIPFDPSKRSDRKGPVEKREIKKPFEEVMQRSGQEEHSSDDSEHFVVKSDKSPNDTFEQIALAPKASALKFKSVEEFTPEEILPEHQDIPLKEFPPRLKEPSLSALLPYGSKVAAQSLKENFEEVEPVVPFTKKAAVPTTNFPTEQPDFGGIAMQNGPISPQAPSLVENPVPVSQSSRVAQIQEIVDQIVQKIYTLSTDGKTETIITLKHPPILENAQVVVTEFKSATRELNVSFENLTQAAQDLLNQNKDSLISGMEQKGFTLHMMTITTIQENRIFTSDSHLARDERGNKEEKREQQQQKEKDS